MRQAGTRRCGPLTCLLLRLLPCHREDAAGPGRRYDSAHRAWAARACCWLSLPNSNGVRCCSPPATPLTAGAGVAGRGRGRGGAVPRLRGPPRRRSGDVRLPRAHAARLRCGGRPWCCVGWMPWCDAQLPLCVLLLLPFVPLWPTTCHAACWNKTICVCRRRRRPHLCLEPIQRRAQGGAACHGRQSRDRRCQRRGRCVVRGVGGGVAALHGPAAAGAGGGAQRLAGIQRGRTQRRKPLRGQPLCRQPLGLSPGHCSGPCRRQPC
jgi:hypothetical protein